MVPRDRDILDVEQDTNRIISLKEFIERIPPVFEALTGVKSAMLIHIREVVTQERFLLTRLIVM